MLEAEAQAREPLGQRRRSGWVWVLVTIEGTPQWVNTAGLRRIKSLIGTRYKGESELIWTTKDKLVCAESADQILTAMGYPAPPPPQVEAFTTGSGEDDGQIGHYEGMSGPQLVAFFNSLVLEARTLGMSSAPEPVERFVNRETGIRRCSELRA